MTRDTFRHDDRKGRSAIATATARHLTPSPRRLDAILDSPQFRRAAYISDSFEMVGHLPGLVFRTSDGLIANACLESFLVHVRLLAEFLVRRPKKDFTAADFIAWPVPQTDAAQRLGQYWWEEASQHVVHFSQKRVPDNPKDVTQIQDLGKWMHEAATDVFEVAEDSWSQWSRGAIHRRRCCVRPSPTTRPCWRRGRRKSKVAALRPCPTGCDSTRRPRSAPSAAMSGHPRSPRHPGRAVRRSRGL